MCVCVCVCVYKLNSFIPLRMVGSFTYKSGVVSRIKAQYLHCLYKIKEKQGIISAWDHSIVSDHINLKVHLYKIKYAVGKKNPISIYYQSLHKINFTNNKSKKKK